MALLDRGANFIVACVLGVGLSACSSLFKTDPSDRKFEITRKWARSTVAQDYLGARRVHRMEPLLTETLVVQGNSIDGVSAYDRESGRLQWRLTLVDGIEGDAVFADGKIYFGASNGFVYCVNIENGEVLWTYAIKAEGLAQPTLHEGKLYVLAGNNVFHVIEASTGKMLWTYNRQEVSTLSIRGGSKAVLEGSSVYIGFSDGYVVSLNSKNGTLQWETLINRNPRFRDVDASPVSYKDRLIVPSYDGGLYSLEKSSGRIMWTQEGGGASSVLIVKDRVYYGSSEGRVVSLDAASGQESWSFATKGLPTEPRFYKQLILVGDSAGPVYALDARTGDMQSSFHPGRGVTSAMAIDESKNEGYFISTDANLFSVKLSWIQQTGRWPWEKN